ncbi:type II toxin-antitoxin system HicA family toxin [Paenibacillus koleovorans]|uniref:type II toxin-antitoxin system HicA family toxin n=1 Tax=Paenibacillus koleovorans TaxID=121608 RepID=UPI000FDA4A63|nr:type II toxin-antitoxin system HicA family toxin [Paenibacillus koleovorans]
MPSWKDVRRFCENDGWELYKQTDHYFYRKESPNGNMLRAKVSMGSGENGPPLFNIILKKQLQVDKQYFNCKI